MKGLSFNVQKKGGGGGGGGGRSLHAPSLYQPLNTLNDQEAGFWG